jgi:hypothetical protein
MTELLAELVAARDEMDTRIAAAAARELTTAIADMHAQNHSDELDGPYVPLTEITLTFSASEYDGFPPFLNVASPDATEWLDDVDLQNWMETIEWTAGLVRVDGLTVDELGHKSFTLPVTHEPADA